MFALSGCLWKGSATKPLEDPDTENNGEEEPGEDDPEVLEEEWRRRNEELKEEQGIYYVPLPHPDFPDNPPVKVRGIYFTGHSIAFQERYERTLKVIENSELNAMVIDIKDDKGRMAYESEIEAVNNLDAYYKPVPLSDIRATMKELKEKGIYTIARIVVFRDSQILPAERPDWCIPLKGGGLYRDAGFAYGNPYIEELWDYNIAIAKEAALLGFNEIQFDYIRFPDKAAYMEQVAYYPGANGRTKAEAIHGFMAKAREELAPYKVYVAYDVFGVIASSWGDTDDIGQCWEDFAARSDYICPMIYPSHYYPVRQGGVVVPCWFGLRFPDTNPVVTITGALTDALKRNAAVENPAIIRPWLQAFTARWLGSSYGSESYIEYGPQQIRQQIDAAMALGIDEYMLWDANNENYPGEAFFTESEAVSRYEQSSLERESKKRDFLGRTPQDAVEAYFEALGKPVWREAYALQSGFQGDGNAYREWLAGAEGKVKEWRIDSSDDSDGTV
ncbi:MAG: putative glycoside hydrolase, partial [Firmicutes bacterium]|nr:putative glycoside hydrolase [Bacillota bacterium]